MRIVVDADRLLDAAGAVQAAAQTTGGVRASLVAQGSASTGRPSSDAAVIRVLNVFDRSLLTLAVMLDDDARALAEASHDYSGTDAAVLRIGPR